MPDFPLTEFEKSILAQAERESRPTEQANRASFSITGSDGKPIGPLRASQGHTMNESWVAQTAAYMRANNLRSAKVRPYYEMEEFSDRINARMTR